MTTFTLLLPCYEEAERLPTTLKILLEHLPDDPASVELLVVDDGSTDGTADVAERAAVQDPRVRLVRHEHNRGKGAAVRTGMLAARGDRIVFTDADLAYEPDEIDRVTAALDRAPVAIGTRRVGSGGERLPRRILSRLSHLATRVVLGLPFADTQCGLKGFRRDAAQAVFGHARVDGFAFDAEVLLVARRLGLDVAQVKVSVTPRRGGSKVNLVRDSLGTFLELWEVRRAVHRGRYDRSPTEEHLSHPGHSDG